MEKKRSLRPGELPIGAVDFILKGLAEVRCGRIVLTAQDSRLVQVEREERIGGSDLLAAKSASRPPAGREHIVKKIRQSFQDLPYGQIIITMRDGEVRQMERLTRSRFTGLDGEGI